MQLHWGGSLESDEIGDLIYVRLKFRRNGVRARLHLSHTHGIHVRASLSNFADDLSNLIGEH